MDHLLDCAIGGGAAPPESVLAGMSDEELEAFTRDVKRHIDAGHAWLLRAVEELDRRQVPERHHVLTTRQWLKRFCQMTGAAASGVVASARSLAHMPDVAKRAEAGEIPSRTCARSWPHGGISTPSSRCTSRSSPTSRPTSMRETFAGRSSTGDSRPITPRR